MGCKAKPGTPKKGHRSSTKYLPRSSSQSSNTYFNGAVSSDSSCSSNLDACCSADQALSRREQIYLSKKLRSKRREGGSASRLRSEINFDDSDQVIYNRKRSKSKNDRSETKVDSESEGKREDKAKDVGGKVWTVESLMKLDRKERTEIAKLNNFELDDNGNVLSVEPKDKQLETLVNPKKKTSKYNLLEGENSEDDDVCECETDIGDFILNCLTILFWLFIDITNSKYSKKTYDVIKTVGVLLLITISLRMLYVPNRPDGCTLNKCVKGRCVVMNRDSYICMCRSSYSSKLCDQRKIGTKQPKCNKIELTNWMADETIAHVPIHELSIPGSHNSFSFHLMKSSPLSPDAVQRLQMNKLSNVLTRRWIRRFGRTQFLDFSEQLHIGVRYFDLRLARMAGVRGSNSRRTQYRFVHGCYGGEWMPAMHAIENFLSQHTSELVILHFQHLYAMSVEDHRRVKRSLRSIFGDMIVERSGHSSDLREMTLAGLRKRGQRVIIFYSQEEDDVGEVASIAAEDPVWPTDYISSPWPNTNRATKLFRFLKKQRSTESQDGSTFKVTQCLLTLKANDIIRYAYRGSLRSLQNRAFLTGVNRFLRQSLRLDGHKVNIAIRDFVDADFTRTVVELNKTPKQDATGNLEDDAEREVGGVGGR